MRGCLRSARATAATSRSVCVIFTPCELFDHRNQRVARRHSARGVDVARHEEMRHRRPALRRPLGHDAADRGDRIRGHRADAAGAAGAADRTCCAARRRPTAGGRGFQNVVGENLAARTGALDLRDVDAVLARELARLRRDARAGGRARLRRGLPRRSAGRRGGGGSGGGTRSCRSASALPAAARSRPASAARRSSDRPERRRRSSR